MDYELIRSDRKTLGLRVRADGALEVRAPRRMPKREIDAAVARHEAWVAKTRQRLEAAAPAPEDRLGPADIRRLGEQALEDLPRRVARFAPLVGVTCGRITVRSQRSKGGRCSGKGNLNFNCLLMLCPPEVRDYIVVHELCHRWEMNHSPAFWAQVGRVLPGYREQEAWLKVHGTAILRRMTG